MSKILTTKNIKVPPKSKDTIMKFSGKPAYKQNNTMTTSSLSRHVTVARENEFRSDRKYIHNYIKSGAWKNRPVYIVGGGPSLKNFNWDRLRGEIVISVNHRPLLDLPECCPSAIVSMDTRAHQFVESNQLGENLLSRFNSFLGYVIYLDTINIKDDRLFFLHNLGRYQFPDNISAGVGNGNNSGYVAMNLAYQLGANPIYLLGFDCIPNGGIQCHYHEGYPVQQSDRIYEKFIKSFNYISTNITQNRIINLNPDSAIDCFPKKSINEIKREQKPIIVSFYTPEYADCVKNLIRSCHLFGFEYDIKEIKSRGTWENNCQYKAEFCLQMIEKHGKDIVWIDADGIIQKFPELFIDFKYDFGCHYRDSRNKYSLLSGTLYFKCNAAVKNLILDWIKINKDNPGKWDQVTLQRAVENNKSITTFNFPANYTQIFDLMKDAGEPIIEHFQNSRNVKREINANVKITKKLDVLANIFIAGSYGIAYKLSDMGFDIHHIDFAKLGNEIEGKKNNVVWGGYRRATYEKGVNNLYLEGGIITPNTFYIDDQGFHSQGSICQDQEYNNNFDCHVNFENKYDPDGHILVCLQGTDYNTILDDFNSNGDDYFKTFLQICYKYLPKDRKILVRTHPLHRDKYISEIFKSGIWRKDWTINTSGTIDDVLNKCSAVVTINSGVHVKALLKNIPVATLGKGMFTGSNVTLECADDFSLLKNIGDISVNTGAVKKYISAIMQHEIKRDWSDLKSNIYFQRWYDKAIETRKVTSRKVEINLKNVEDKKVSIMMPAWNCEKFIGQAIQSIHDQTYKNIELIIVNDASTDQTKQVASQHAANDQRIKIIDNKSNIMEAASRNVALEFCTGDYIAKLDADDWYNETYIEKTVKFLEDNPTFDCVSTNMFWNPGGVEKFIEHNDHHGMIPDGYMAGQQRCNPVNAAIVARKFVYDIVKFNPEIRFGSDGDWDIRACLKGIRFGFVDEPLYYYRKHPGGSVFLPEVSAQTTRENLQRIANASVQWENAEWRHAELFVNTACNLNCPFCSQRDFMNNAPKYNMKIREIKEFIDRSQECNLHYDIVKVTGGEPSLHRNIDQIISLIKESGITNKVMLFSNGLKLKESTINLCDLILISQREPNKSIAQEIKNKFPEKVISQTSIHKKLPDFPLDAAKSLPALCNCRGYQLRDRIFYICPNAGNHLQRIYQNAITKFQISIDQDWHKYFMQIDRYNMPLCQVCLGNRKIWEKTQ